MVCVFVLNSHLWAQVRRQIDIKAIASLKVIRHHHCWIAIHNLMSSVVMKSLYCDAKCIYSGKLVVYLINN